MGSTWLPKNKLQLQEVGREPGGLVVSNACCQVRNYCYSFRRVDVNVVASPAASTTAEAAVASPAASPAASSSMTNDNGQ